MQNTIAVSNEVGSLLVDRLKRDGVNLYAAAQTITACHQDHTQARFWLGDTSQEAKHAVGVVIAANATLIYGVLAADMGAPFKQMELAHQPRMIGQCYDAARKRR